MKALRSGEVNALRPSHARSARVNEAPSMNTRDALRNAKRVVVKVGSRTLAARPELPMLLAAQFATLSKEGRSIVLISSGAVALGMERLGMSHRPTELASLQAAASAGQSLLMARYDEAFRAHGLTCAQVLLTQGDLSNRNRVNNARAALAALLDQGAIPIINENDVVATEELRFTDNDQLAAMVVPLVNADALVLLSDVPGVLDETGTRISVLDSLEHFTDTGAKSSVGRGGMTSKLSAAAKARRAGAATVIGSAFEDEILLRVLSGEDVGTCLPLIANVLRARHHWIAYALKPRGTLIVDEGAARALRENQKSLLPVGVIGLRGEFRRGDAVVICDVAGVEIGRGLARLSTLEAARAAGKKGDELQAALGGDTEPVVVHKDDLVVSQ